MPKYEDCVIYTIRSGEYLYVGSTCNFTRRKCCHKSSLNNENDKAYNYKLYKMIRENDNEWDMQPHKLFPCKNKMEMRIEEERCRVELNADLNDQSCHGKSEKSIKNSLEKSKKWAINNKIKVAGYKKKYADSHREMGCEKSKKYYAENKDMIKERNKEKILQQTKERMTCECGCEILKHHITRHRRSKKHLKRLEENQKIINDV